MSTRRLAVAATGLCVALGATVWTACATVPLGGTAPEGAQQTTDAGQPAQELEQRAVEAALRRQQVEAALRRQQELRAVEAALRRQVEEQQGAITREQQGAITTELTAAVVEQLRQAVASISDLLEGGDTTADEMQVRLAMLTARVAALQEMVRRLQTQLQEVGVPER